MALNFERASPESGTKLPLHYFHNLEYVLQKMQHCSLNIAGNKNLRSFVISRHFDVSPFIIETTASLYVNDPFTPKRFAPQNHSHQWCNTNSGHLPWNHCLTKAPRHLSSPCINEELQLVIGRPHSIETPLNSFKNRSHIFKSLLVPTVRMILHYDFTTPQVNPLNPGQFTRRCTAYPDRSAITYQYQYQYRFFGSVNSGNYYISLTSIFIAH